MTLKSAKRAIFAIFPFLSSILLLSTPLGAATAVPVLRADGPTLGIKHGRWIQKTPWVISPQIGADTLITSEPTITLFSAIDTLVLQSPPEWMSTDVAVITQSGDTALTRILRVPVDPFSNPDPALLNRLPDNMLTREQACFDLDALFNALSQIHPDIYSVAGQERIVEALQQVRNSFPDTLSTLDFYREAAPLVSLIGDGHTMLWFPYNDLFTPELRRLPLRLDIKSDRRIVVAASVDPSIPVGSVITAINGHPSEEMLTSMLPFVSGEREHFKIMRLDNEFAALFELLYGGHDSYDIAFVRPDSERIENLTVEAATNARIPRRRKSAPKAPYSFTVDTVLNTAIMDFRSFSGTPEMMKQFCDSMFSFIRDENIGGLIIDLRNNGGGNSLVGDVLLRYISPVPFIQMEKALINSSPLIDRLSGRFSADHTPTFFKVDQDHYVTPLSPEEGHFDGPVVLLTSNHTFSSASSFAWAFKHFGMGKVVGEETGGMNISFGDILTWNTPVGQIPCSISYKRFWHPGADESDIHGTIPDLIVPADDALDFAWTAMAGIDRAGFGNSNGYISLKLIDPTGGKFGKITDAIYHSRLGSNHVRILDSQLLDEGSILYDLIFDADQIFKPILSFTLIIGDRPVRYEFDFAR